MAHQADARRALDERGYTGALIHGDNPLKLFEKAVRDRIIDSYYWKEQCFGLNAATILDRALELTFIGGTYGVAQKPTPFLCLAFKTAATHSGTGDHRVLSPTGRRGVQVPACSGRVLCEIGVGEG